jgi:uncharacterized repeat protein (TIGR03943 family)
VTVAQTLWQRLANSAIFLAWLAVIGSLLVSQSYLSFLAPGFWVFLALAIVVLAAFAAARASGPSRTVCEMCTPGPTRGRIVLLLVPLVFLVANLVGMLNSDAGSFAFDRRFGLGGGGRPIAVRDLRPPAEQDSSTTQPDAPHRVNKPAGDATLLSIQDASLVGRRVKVEGIAYTSASLPKGTAILFRFVIACCGADAQPVWVLVTGKEAASLTRDNWFQVEGELTASEVTSAGQSQIVPTIRCDTAPKPWPRPAEPYLR